MRLLDYIPFFSKVTPFEFQVASRYLKSRRREGFISVIAGFSFLGIMIGVATLIVVMAVMNGFRQELMGKILGVNGHIFVQPYNDYFQDYDAIAERLSKINGITLAAPIIEGQVLAATPNGTSGALVRGIREKDLKNFPAIVNGLVDGTLDGIEKTEKIVIGRRLAGSLGVGIGDKVKLLSPKGASTPFGLAPRQKIYEIGAMFEVGMSEFDASFIFMPLPEAQLYFGMEAQVAMIEIFVKEPDKIDKISLAIKEAIGRPHVLTDWRFRNRTFFSALEIERNVMFLILAMIVLVAAFNIISGLTMLVKDKSRGIAILRTMGATRSSILVIFVVTGAAIGVGGTISGFFLGLIVAWNVESIRQFVSYLTGAQIFPPELYFLTGLPSEIRASEVFAVVGMALTLSFLATLYPAWRAARLDPVEALRTE